MLPGTGPEALAAGGDQRDESVSAYKGGLHVRGGRRTGRYQTKQQTCRSCGSSYIRYEEKETDVNIAVSLVADAAEDFMDAALVVSADSDLVPAIKTAKRIRPDLFIAAAFPPKRYPGELHALMPRSLHIGHNIIRGAQLPEIVSDSETGFQWKRPAKWQ